MLSGMEHNYQKRLSALPVTREGLKQQCDMIRERISQIQQKDSVTTKPPGPTDRRSLKEMFAELRNSDRFKKGVGLYLCDDTIESLQASLDGVTVGATVNVKQEEGDRLPLTFGYVGLLATYDAQCAVDLVDFYKKTRNVNYDPTFIDSAVIAYPRSDCHVSVFSNGKMVINGVTNTSEALVASRNSVELLKQCGYNPVLRKENLRVHNVSGMLNLNSQVDILGFHEAYPRCTYYSEVFCAVSYRPATKTDQINLDKSLGVCCQIFATGKILIVGHKDERDINDFLVELYDILEPFIGAGNNPDGPDADDRDKGSMKQ
ncbi:uncharacterized protein LOC129584716 [Paramacrobiotus metropolitanus]|uniref:uncharacterized protein LOC129584716 n=1 Tax=Paramacrobiotus metropolitanus TaxID=2943436 RepID=UPI00244633DD|nr:uncharacterized protein LOC129584716 [Paramacrobiotus metropolitanus]